MNYFTEIINLIDNNKISSFFAFAEILKILKELSDKERKKKLKNWYKKKIKNKEGKISSLLNNLFNNFLKDQNLLLQYNIMQECLKKNDLKNPKFANALLNIICYEYKLKTNKIKPIIVQNPIQNCIHDKFPNIGFLVKFNNAMRDIRDKCLAESNVIDAKWGWGDPNNINDDIVNKQFNDQSSSMEINVILKPKMKNEKDKNLNIIVKKNKNENKIQYFCNKQKIYNNKIFINDFNDLQFNHVIENKNKNKDIFKDTLQEKIKNLYEKDVFIAAYGQSGSGKSYLMFGEEDNINSKGIVNYSLNELKKDKNIKSIKLLPLQVYDGSVYHAFYEINNKYKYPEFNINDLDHFEINKNECVQYLGKINDDNKEYFDKCNKNQKMYPPVRKLINNIFNYSTSQLHLIDKNAFDITEKEESNIQKILKNNIKRPVRDTGQELNIVSSRSHLFLIFQVIYNDEYNTKRYLTFVDFGGIEAFPTDEEVTKKFDPFEHMNPDEKKEIVTERRYLVNDGLVVFREMVQQYMGTSKIKKIKKIKCSNVMSYDQTKRPILHLTKSKSTSQSSAVFNLIRGLSGVFSPYKCNHVIYGVLHTRVPKIDKKNNDKKQEYKHKLICNTQNTILKSLSSFIPKK